MLISGQGPLLAAVSGRRLEPAPEAWTAELRRAGLPPGQVWVFDNADDGFVGGWMGMPGRERLVVPASWWAQLSEEARVAQLTRRRAALQSGERTRGLALGVGWVLLGFTLAAAISQLASSDQLVSTWAWFTAWSFLGLLVLPTPSRRGVYRVDALTLDRVPRVQLAAALRDIDARQEDEPERAAWVETLLHPVPALNRRLAAIEGDPEVPQGAWHAARVALLAAWGLGSPLSRAVHCNVGRTELWAMYPGD